MGDSNRDWNEAAVIVTQIVKKAGAEAQRIRKHGLERSFKAHQDFVTGADLHVERFVRDRISEIYPGDRVFGEEATGKVTSVGITISQMRQG